ncbi:hypothetical protein cypCar_00013212, partial [Cyprinus carpio]
YRCDEFVVNDTKLGHVQRVREHLQSLENSVSNTDRQRKRKQSDNSSPDSKLKKDSFKKTPPKVPYKAIALATFLFLVGSILIVVGSLLLAGYINVVYPDRTIPVLIIGILIFLPGFYHLRIAYYASKGYRGYSYDDIPDFDD